jgi:hypothetical protein
VVTVENYSHLCDIALDLSTVPLISRQNSAGKTYYSVDYDVVLSFGLTELKAQVAWFNEKVSCLLFYINEKKNTLLFLSFCHFFRILNLSFSR